MSCVYCFVHFVTMIVTCSVVRVKSWSWSWKKKSWSWSWSWKNMEVLVLVLVLRPRVLVLVLTKKSYLHHWLLQSLGSEPEYWRISGTRLPTSLIALAPLSVLPAMSDLRGWKGNIYYGIMILYVQMYVTRRNSAGWGHRHYNVFSTPYFEGPVLRDRRPWLPLSFTRRTNAMLAMTADSNWMLMLWFLLLVVIVCSL